MWKVILFWNSRCRSNCLVETQRVKRPIKINSRWKDLWHFNLIEPSEHFHKKLADWFFHFTEDWQWQEKRSLNDFHSNLLLLEVHVVTDALTCFIICLRQMNTSLNTHWEVDNCVESDGFGKKDFVYCDFISLFKLYYISVHKWKNAQNHMGADVFTPSPHQGTEFWDQSLR